LLKFLDPTCDSTAVDPAAGQLLPSANRRTFAMAILKRTSVTQLIFDTSFQQAVQNYLLTQSVGIYDTYIVNYFYDDIYDVNMTVSFLVNVFDDAHVFRSARIPVDFSAVFSTTAKTRLRTAPVITILVQSSP
jgi:hypothetical protein